ncbi:MAG: hypothetical protein DWQ07_03320 [Chloroflexi bacterium]|nr:MAG: hypothetical protein DWQ07_03320 [Chloroflexota bacterium]MBL1193469.1 hypothetical protein [Chloroflexota bacterium]NOH10760.1 hypothetical protein [Chloroflexota bacterium]
MIEHPPVIEKRPEWEARYKDFLANYEATGETDWKIYARPRNKQRPSGPGVDLSQSRLLFITSAGAYLPNIQEPFDAENDLGDHSLRVIPSSTELSALAYAHTHYDHAMVNADPQTLVPLVHLREMVQEGIIGELSPSFISFSGYLPDAGRVVDETIPAMLKVAKEEQVRAALLVPA